ncbi:MAG: 16S rRNA (uracil(1498)-N(3))-methyltransferase [Acidobacteria bacterium]|nr:16S rRNA (uracil(1498)-N(3))-methyltransferase [Acidobacteriota bacterium]
MQIRRLFVETTPLPSETIQLNPSEHHYATRVMRLKQGQVVELISPEGCMDATLESISEEATVVRIQSLPKIKNEPSVSITLFQGMPDHLEKLEFIVQKSVELGVNRIVTFTSRYTDAKYHKMNMSTKMERMRKIAKEAVRQCGRTRIPQLEGPRKFLRIFDSLSSHEAAFLFFEKEMKNSQAPVQNPENIAVIVGPEGGFSDDEVKTLIDKNCHAIHLPGRILRTETAAIACLTLIQAKFGDFFDVF